jgi:hypothetical protein
MIGYAAAEIFTGEELFARELAERMVLVAPYLDEETRKPIRCHELARAVGKMLKLPVCDGRFGFVEHSWLWLREPEPELARWNLPKILDVYVPGAIPQCQLVDTATGLPWRYQWDVPRTDVNERIVTELVELFERLPHWVTLGDA